MKKFNLFILSILFSFLTFFVAADTEATADGAEKVEKIFTEIAAAGPESGPAEFVIQEDDFNSWLNMKVKEKEFIEDVQVEFKENNEADLSLIMHIREDLDAGYYANMLATLFKGEQKLKASGKIKAGDGKFSFVVNSLTMNEVIVTPALIYPLVSMLLPDYKLDKPLELPHGLTNIRTADGVLTIIRQGIVDES